MEIIQAELANWGLELEQKKLPRWEEMPELELYMDQVITLVDRYLSPFILREKHPLLTSSMVNNYVKLGLIPPPEKKRYNRRHIAFLVAITLLKQVLAISQVKEGIVFQGRVIGIREAYNLFCEEQEKAFGFVCAQAQGKKYTKDVSEPIGTQFLALKAATTSFAMKCLAEKTVELEEQYLKERENVNE